MRILKLFSLTGDKVSEKYFQSNNTHKISLNDQRRLRMRAVFSDEEADSRFLKYLEIYEINWKLFPDSIPCLEACQDHRLGLITNGEGKLQRSKIQKLGLDPYFSEIIISRKVDCAKPDKAIFELAAKKAGVPMEECIYVGDRLHTDALASRQFAQNRFLGV
jgi:putative hydrolase of the HAD superfamily